MENATKALLIAAGVFLGLMIISMCVYAYQNLTDYFASSEQEKSVKQLTQFNNQYEAYIRDDIRGNEILSLINKVLDYNRREADVEGIKFERMIISIEIGSTNINKFIYNESGEKLIEATLSNATSDDELKDISNVVNESEEYTEAQLKQLTEKIANIFDADNDETKRDKRDSGVKSIIGKKYSELTSDKQTDLKNDVLKYYQYQNFKKAHFDYVSSGYNEGTGRIVKLSFKFNGKIE